MTKSEKFLEALRLLDAKEEVPTYSPETHTAKEYFKVVLKVEGGSGKWSGFVKQVGPDTYKAVTNSGNELHDYKGGTAIKYIVTHPTDIISKKDARVNKKYGELEVVRIPTSPFSSDLESNTKSSIPKALSFLEASKAYLSVLANVQNMLKKIKLQNKVKEIKDNEEGELEIIMKPNYHLTPLDIKNISRAEGVIDASGGLNHALVRY